MKPMITYVFYFWSLIPNVNEWYWDIFSAVNIADAFYDADTWAADRDTYAIAAEVYSSSLSYTNLGASVRAQDLHQLGIPFPDNFDPKMNDLVTFKFPDGTPSHFSKLGSESKTDSKAIILKANILPVEVHNSTKVDPNTCMDVTRLLCKGAAGSRSL